MMQLTYKKARQFRQLITALLTSQTLGYDERFKLRNAKAELEQNCLTLDWKFSCCQETFSEMKTHKSIIDNADNLEKLIEKNQEKKLSILNSDVPYNLPIFDFHCDFFDDKEKTSDYAQICEELNGVILNYI